MFYLTSPVILLHYCKAYLYFCLCINCRVLLKDITERYLHTARQAVASHSPCRALQILPLREVLFRGKLIVYLQWCYGPMTHAKRYACGFYVKMFKRHCYLCVYIFRRKRRNL